MSNHYTQLDQIAAKVNELIYAFNDLNPSHFIQPLNCAPPPPDSPTVDYPEYSRSKIDHTTLGS